MNHCQLIMFCDVLWISLRVYRSKPGILTAVADLFATLSSCLDSSNTKQVVQQKNHRSMKQIQSHLGCTQIAQSLLPISWIVVGCVWIFQDFPWFILHVASFFGHAEMIPGPDGFPSWPRPTSRSPRRPEKSGFFVAPWQVTSPNSSIPKTSGNWWTAPQWLDRIHDGTWIHMDTLQ